MRATPSSKRDTIARVGAVIPRQDRIIAPKCVTGYSERECREPGRLFRPSFIIDGLAGKRIDHERCHECPLRPVIGQFIV